MFVSNFLHHNFWFERVSGCEMKTVFHLSMLYSSYLLAERATRLVHAKCTPYSLLCIYAYNIHFYTKRTRKKLIDEKENEICMLCKEWAIAAAAAIAVNIIKIPTSALPTKRKICWFNNFIITIICYEHAKYLLPPQEHIWTIREKNAFVGFSRHIISLDSIWRNKTT